MHSSFISFSLILLKLLHSTISLQNKHLKRESNPKQDLTTISTAQKSNHELIKLDSKLLIEWLYSGSSSMLEYIGKGLEIARKYNVYMIPHKPAKSGAKNDTIS